MVCHLDVVVHEALASRLSHALIASKENVPQVQLGTYTRGQEDVLRLQVAVKERARCHGVEKADSTGNVLEDGKLEWERQQRVRTALEQISEVDCEEFREHPVESAGLSEHA